MSGANSEWLGDFDAVCLQFMIDEPELGFFLSQLPKSENPKQQLPVTLSGSRSGLALMYNPLLLDADFPESVLIQLKRLGLKLKYLQSLGGAKFDFQDFQTRFELEDRITAKVYGNQKPDYGPSEHTFHSWEGQLARMAMQGEIYGAFVKVQPELEQTDVASVATGSHRALSEPVQMELRHLSQRLVARGKRQRRIRKGYPSRRFQDGFSSRNRFLAKMLVAVDCSWSISNTEWRLFEDFLQGLYRRGLRFTVLVVDHRIRMAYPFQGAFRNRPALEDQTSFEPVFNWVRDRSEYQEILYLTDGLAQPPRQTFGKTVTWFLTQTQGVDLLPGKHIYLYE